MHTNNLPSTANRQLEHIDHTPSGHTHPICLLADNIADPRNVGSLFRIADALGIEHIYLAGNSATPPDPKLRKTSRAAEQYVPYSTAAEALQTVHDLKTLGYQIVALEITSQSLPLTELSLDPNRKVCLIMGAENQGISTALLEAADATTHIPMLGQNSSLNVAVAAGIGIYTIMELLPNQTAALKHP